MSNLTVIVPCYNEEKSLPRVLPELTAFCQQRDWHLVFVNDGSTDNTKSVLENYRDKIGIINHKLNRGYGGALKSGIMASQTEYSVFIDADGQHELQDLDKLYKIITARDADMVIGSRKGLPGNWFRSLGKKIIRGLAKAMMHVPVYDINSGMKIIRTKLGKRYLHLYPDSMAFSDIICLVFLYNRHLVLEEPIQINQRIAGTSTIGIRTAFQTIMEIVNIVTLFNPFRIFFPVAFILFLTGFLWGIRFILAEKGVSVGSGMLLTMSVIVLLLGLIAEQLAAIRRKTD
ncbi:MAG: glycosyltransferase family 2 protein [Candidatus Cloacimonadaceae bacterium]